MLLSRTNTATRYLAQILVFLRGKLPNKLPRLFDIKYPQIFARSWHQLSQIFGLVIKYPVIKYVPGPGRSAASCAQKTPTVSFGPLSLAASVSSNPAVTVVTVESVTTRARYQGRRAVWQNKMLLLNKML